MADRIKDRRLTRGKGPLRVLEIIAKLEKTLGRHPIGNEIHDFQVVTTGFTGRNAETIQEMTWEGLIGNANGYYLTHDGIELLRKHGIEI